MNKNKIDFLEPVDNSVLRKVSHTKFEDYFPVKNKKDQPSDLLIFDKLFAEEKSKPIPGGVEYRVGNLEQAITRARLIISVYKLKLEAISTGAQAQYRAFDVKEVKP